MNQTPISMQDVALKLGLPARRNSEYVDCPYCHGKRKLNVNYGKNVFRCNKCGDKAIHTQGGPLDLYMLFMGIDDIREAYKALRGSESYQVTKRPQPLPPMEEQKAAPIAVRDATYRALLSLANLHERHLGDLMARGLTKEQIVRFGYKSTPSDLKAVAKELQRLGCTLEAVPGFYEDDKGEWTMVHTGSGILIPQRNSKGQIQGFQIRLDQPRDDGPRYISLSSRDRKGGAPSHSYVHFRKGLRGIQEVVLTEGALKADVICALSGYSVISVPGVNSQKYLPQAFNTLLKRGMRKLSIAYDMDSETNVHVQAAKEKLIETLNNTCTGCGLVVPERFRKEIYNGTCPRCGRRLGLSHSVRRWDLDENGKWAGNYKGLDDYLFSLRTNMKER